MRGFQKILAELREVVGRHQPGEPLSPPHSMPSIEINGYRLSYVAAGVENSNLPPVILLHGFGGFFMDWPRVMAPLAKLTRVYAIDLPGWGFSELNPHMHALEDEVKVLGSFLQRLDLKNVILCGISYGAGVAWASAALHLSRLSRAVLLNPMPPHPMRFLRSPIYRGIFLLNSTRLGNRYGTKILSKSQYKIICRENLLNDRLLDTFYLDLAYMVIKQPKMTEILFRHAIGAKKVDWNVWEHRLAGIKIPVTILQGEQDRIFSMKSSTYLQGLIPHSQVITVPDCGHAMVFDQHKRVSDLIIHELLPKEANRESNVESNKESYERIKKDLWKTKA